ncbi:MAG: VOC family protein [Deltaproteobacteria bacterium]|nr:VOC family protein [Nannocystaceae bacterium]
MTDGKTIPGKFVWFEHISSDAKQAQAFYAELFGWHAQAFPEGGGYEMIVAGDEMIGGYGTSGADERAQWMSCVSVADVDAAVAASVAAGGKVVVPAADSAGIGRLARVADPQGAELWVLNNTRGDPPDRKLAPVGTFFWNELHTTAAAEAAAFYTKVFGYTHAPMDMGPSGTYHVLESAGEGRGGISDDLTAGVAPHWLPYVHADDPDATLERARKLGASTPVDAMDIPGVGRFGVLKDPTGAILAVMKPMPRQG